MRSNSPSSRLRARAKCWVRGGRNLILIVWCVSPPAKRMKAGREHRVPLSRRALKIVKAMHQARERRFVFPGQKSGKPLIGDGARNGAAPLEHRGGDGTWLPLQLPRLGGRADQLSQMRFAKRLLPDAIENKAEAAYRRGDLFDKRRKLMDAMGRLLLGSWGRLRSLRSSDEQPVEPPCLLVTLKSWRA